MTEEQLLSWLRTRLHTRDARVRIGAGPDDCAILDVAPAAPLAVSTDLLLEGTHVAADVPPHRMGWKAMAAALSDLAASGCRPRWALAGVALRRGAGESWAEDLAEGLIGCAEQYGVELVGGDITATDGPAAVCVTVLGVPLPGGPVRRDGAQPGDVLLVTGALGGSSVGRHLEPVPRLSEVAALLGLARVHACMDISDGLALDLSRMMRESHTGAVLKAEQIPIHAEALELARVSGRTPLVHALEDGEDFELLLAMAPEDWASVRPHWPPEGFDTPLTLVGEVLAGEGLSVEDAAGERRTLSPRGYEHAF